MARHNEILTQFQEISPNFDYSNEGHINLVSVAIQNHHTIIYYSF